MRAPRHTHAARRGHSATPILVFLGIVVLSVVFFFALTLPRQLELRRAAEDKARAEAARPAAETAPTPAVAMDPPTDVPTAADAGRESGAGRATPAPGEAGPVRFASPRQFVQSLVGKLVAGDVAGAESLLGPDALAGEKAAFFRSIFGPARLRPSSSLPLREIGDVGEYYRWGVRLDDAATASIAGAAGNVGASLDVPPPIAPSDRPAAAMDPIELEIDVARDPDAGWRAVAVHFPERLRLAVANVLGEAGVPAAVAPVAEDAQDPLRIAGQFLRAVFRQDFAVARGVTDTDLVTREKLAGLCILFEEGAYAIADERPLSATATGPDAAWVIVKVISGRDGQPSDFGLELRRLASGAWRVAGVNFSKMLASYAASAGLSEGVAYTPIVQNPQGGESLVVYFDFDEARLVPRAQRQLEIVANLLRDDPRRTLRLSGHADAIGSDTYNQRLSAARAYAVKEALAGLGVAPRQIVTEGLGTLRPLDPNTKPDGSDNPEGRSRNRRTEIFLDF